MKTALTVAALMLAPMSVIAQTPAPSATTPASGTPGAAATLPNAFDTPVPAGSRPAPVAAQTTAPAPEAADPVVVEAAEAMLRKTVAAMQAGTPNYADMSPELAEKVREIEAQVTPVIQSFGALQSVSHLGNENGAELFVVGFENQATQWLIAQDAEGKMRALLFRPEPEA